MIEASNVFFISREKAQYRFWLLQRGGECRGVGGSRCQDYGRPSTVRLRADRYRQRIDGWDSGDSAKAGFEEPAIKGYPECA